MWQKCHIGKAKNLRFISQKIDQKFGPPPLKFKELPNIFDHVFFHLRFKIAKPVVQLNKTCKKDWDF